MNNETAIDGHDLLLEGKRALRFENAEAQLYHALNRITPPSKEEERELGKRILAGDESAVKELVERNLRLLRLIAQREIGRATMSIGDLINTGYSALEKAAKKFDHRKAKGGFINYAYPWIKNEMRRAIADHAGTPVPSRIASMRKKAFAILWEKQGLGEKPSHRDIAALLCVSEEELGKILGTASLERSFSLDHHDDEDMHDAAAESLPSYHNVPDHNACDPETIIEARDELRLCLAKIQNIIRTTADMPVDHRINPAAQQERRKRNVIIVRGMLGFNCERRKKDVREIGFEIGFENEESVRNVFSRAVSHLVCNKVIEDKKDAFGLIERLEMLEELSGLIVSICQDDR